MQVASVKQSIVCHGREKLIILVQGHESLYNLQHKDYDNNLVKIIPGWR
jgi:competence protein ComGC